VSSPPDDDAVGLADGLRALEAARDDERLVLLCLLAGSEIELDESDLAAALRRAELLLAAGGDPRRPLELHGRAVTALAEDLDSSERRAQLAVGLASLHPLIEAENLTGARQALELLRKDSALAWQCLAISLLAEHLADDE
jgi:hypothetical protein